MLLYLRCILIILWLPFPFIFGFFLALFQWGNISLDHIVAHVFAVPVMWILGVKVDFENIEEFEKHQPCIYVANHQGALDIITFGYIFPRNTVVIAKKEMAYIPFLNLFFVAAGNILVNRQKRTSAVVSLNKAVSAIRNKKVSIWIFPEGTRNYSDQPLLPFKKGAFHMAIGAQVPIVPLIATPIRRVLDWDNKKLYGGTVRMRVFPPIPTVGLKPTDVDKLSAQVREVMLEAIRGLGSTS